MIDPMVMQETIVIAKDRKPDRSNPMGWSAKFTSARQLASNKPAEKSPDIGTGHVDTDRQYNAALTAAQDIMDSGAVGKVGKGIDVEVLMSGHTNPGHEPKDGWVNDNITIQIKQVSKDSKGK